MKEYVELAQNMDHCPKTDQILTRTDCSGCPHYVGFFMSDMGLPCVRCCFPHQYYEENPYEYRRGPEGELILPGFFDDSGGSGVTVLDEPAREETPTPDEKAAGK